MKVKLGKTYGDGSQDITFDNMSKAMKETLIRLGMIKCIEDSVKVNAEWLSTLNEGEAPKEPVYGYVEGKPYIFTDALNRPMCKGCRPDTCVGCGEVEDDEPQLCAACNGSGEGMYDGTRCRYCNGTGEDKRED